MLRWKKWIFKNKYEGDKKTPTGRYAIGSLYFRKDRKETPKNKIESVRDKKTYGLVQ